ncbi:unnamed protein product [Musa banksii]
MPGFRRSCHHVQIANPMELWIQDRDDLRLSLPHDVEAGALKKVILSDGSVMTAKSAKSISLRQPIDLLLPLNCSRPKNCPLVSGLLTIAGVRHGSHQPQTCSLTVHSWPNIPHLIRFSMS